MILKIQKEITPDDMIYLTDIFGYAETIETVNDLGTLTLDEYLAMRDEKNVKISQVLETDENGEIKTVQVEETVESENPQSRQEYLTAVFGQRLHDLITQTMLEAEKLKLDTETAEKAKIIEQGIIANVEKTPMQVEIDENS